MSNSSWIPGDNTVQPGHDGPEMAAPGARFIHVASGTGVLATGIATYREMENPVATRMAKRQAYMAAYTESRKNMAEFPMTSLAGCGWVSMAVIPF